MYLHKRLIKLYVLRAKKNIPDWKKKSVNRLLKKEKAKLTELLNKNLSKTEVRQLNTEALTDKKVISLFESTLSRSLGIKTNDLTEDIFILSVFFFQVFEDVVKKGFEYKGEKYMFLTASAGQIRVKKAQCIKTSAYEQIKNKLSCGLTVEEINSRGGIIPNKYLAYSALNGSATEPWTEFDINKSIVVDDFETDVFGEVDFIDMTDYSITRKNMGVPIPNSDGFGMTLCKPTRMIRGPWLKGLMCYFPFDEFIKQKCPNGECRVTDIYGKEHDVIAEDIQHILTKSQFKLYKFYDSWKEYQENFIKYGCEIGYCNAEENYIPKARINYQMFQSLEDITDDEISAIIKPTQQDIDAIGNDFQATMRLLGAYSTKSDKDSFQKALEIYPELLRDSYSREILKQTKKSLIKQAKSGRLKVNGRYQFLVSDPYAFCEWLFLDEQNPKGLLDNGEVYTKFMKDGVEVACLRSPHLYREWPIRTNKKNTETEKWFADTSCVYISSHDLITKIVQADFDGDKLLVLQDKKIVGVAKRNMKNIVPLYYEMRKGKAEQIRPEVLYEGMALSFSSGNIGPKSNLITIVHNNGKEDRQEALNVVKWLTAEVNFTIDFAKTLYMPQRPKEVDKIIKAHTKGGLPNFFQYAKDKDPHQCEATNNSTMNRISDAFTFTPVKFAKTVSKFEYKRLLSDMSFEPTAKSYQVLERYDWWNTRKGMIFNQETNQAFSDASYPMQKIRENILTETGEDISFVTNSLVYLLYKHRKNSLNKLLWSCFGDEIVKNLQINTLSLGKICKVCGKRFEPNKFVGDRQLTCSEECAQKLDGQRIAEKRSVG